MFRGWAQADLDGKLMSLPGDTAGRDFPAGHRVT